MSNYKYIGNELHLFAEANNWKKYWSRTIQDYIDGDVLEVGAGIGNNTQLIAKLGCPSITCLEPDPVLANQLTRNLTKFDLMKKCTVTVGCTNQLPDSSRYNTILYIDVLEHIHHDVQELERVASLLTKGGHLVVLAPAHNCFYSSFDKNIGHYRRYNASMLRAIAPTSLSEVKMIYLDSIGSILSLANKVILKQSSPKPNQIKMWDQWVIIISRFVDRLIRYSIGKTIIGVWEKD